MKRIALLFSRRNRAAKMAAAANASDHFARLGWRIESIIACVVWRSGILRIRRIARFSNTSQIAAATPQAAPAAASLDPNKRPSAIYRPAYTAMNPKSRYCLMRIASRSGLGASPRIASTSPMFLATWSARPESGMPRGGIDAFENCGAPFRIAIMTIAAAASHPTARVLAERTGRIFGEIGQDEIRAGAANGDERLHHRALQVQPAVARRRDDHAEFPGDLICADRDGEPLARHPDDVEIRQRGLHHQHVRAFLQIELHFM